MGKSELVGTRLSAWGLRSGRHGLGGVNVPHVAACNSPIQCLSIKIRPLLAQGTERPLIPSPNV